MSVMGPTPNAKPSAAVTPRAMNSMTLAISHDNATRMLEASRSLNAALHKLQNDGGANVGSGSSDAESLIDAAKMSQNSLLKAHMSQLQKGVDTKEMTIAEMRTCLLLFLDLDTGKSNKLVRAFQELKTHSQVGEMMRNSNSQDLHLGREEIIKLFKCFLISISTCIHYDGSHANADRTKPLHNDKESQGNQMDTSGTGPATADKNRMRPVSESEEGWSLSRQTKTNIDEIAVYATDKLIDYVTKKTSSTPSPIVTFQLFGEWYNSGGFSVVPWLELLDLAKWHYAGKAAEKAAAAERAIEKQNARNFQRQAAKPYKHNSAMDPIMESMDNPFNSPHLKAPRHGHPASFPTRARVVATFEFAGKKEYNLPITDENLRMFENLVEKTGLSKSSPRQIYNILLRHSKDGTGPWQGYGVLYRQDLPALVRDLVPDAASSHFSQQDMESFSTFFNIFFLSFSRIFSETYPQIRVDQVLVKELAVGFSFLCAGNKSQKLDETFKMMASQETGYMSRHQLMRFIRSYLRMLVGISLLTSSPHRNLQHTNALVDPNRNKGHVAALCNTTILGSNWILDNFLRNFGSKKDVDRINFEDFASWYTDGGFKIAPWLEFLDHKKFVGLLHGNNHRSEPAPKQAPRQQPAFHSPSAPPMNPPNSSGKIRSFDEFVAGSPSPHQRKKTPRSTNAKKPSVSESKDILSTFPLSNGRSLIVLREDAAYVRAVVEQFGLLQSSPNAVWTKLLAFSKKNPVKPLEQRKAALHKSGIGKCRDLDQKIFVDGVLKSVPAKCRRKRSPPPLAATPQDTLKFFFLSFDMKEVDRVAANQLMGGLTLLCGGSKTTKLSFAFSLFDGRSDEAKKKKKKSEDITSLCGKEVFYFLRSILIVLFSCCKQSLELTAGPVGSYIADAANMVTNDVMKYQWRMRKVERINFDEFGEWYNEGGFEVAPWLELLDLDKWAFLDKEKAEQMISNAHPLKPGLKSRLKDTTNKQHTTEDTSTFSKPTPTKEGLHPDFFPDCPPAPADEDFDPNQDALFGTDMTDDIEAMDSFDVDFFDSTLSKENVNNMPGMVESLSAEYLPEQDLGFQDAPIPLTFRLSTNNNDHQMVSVSPRRVGLLKSLVLESGMNEISISTLCESIIGETQGTTMSKEQFDSSIASFLDVQRMKKMPMKTKAMFNSLLASIYDEFDTTKTGRADAGELACGLMVLCGGRKSDKLEYAFEVLDKMKEGMVTRVQMVRYLHSFLTVLLHISSCRLGEEPAEKILATENGELNAITDKRLVGWVSSWATEEVFKSTPQVKDKTGGTQVINFDNFADWYTRGGYNSIAWLELLDLQKWILGSGV